MRTRNVTDEIVFRGLKLAYTARSRFRCVVRVNDEHQGEYPAMDITELMVKINEFMEGLLGDGISINRSVKTTLNNGYLLSFDLSQNGRAVVFTAELVRA